MARGKRTAAKEGCNQKTGSTKITLRVVFLICLSLVLAVICVIVSAVMIIDISKRKNTSLPEQVQSNLPKWVDSQLITPNKFSRPQIDISQVNGVVIHYVGNPNTSAQANRNYFDGLSVTGETSASSHFIVGLEGEILQCVPLNEVAYCTGSRNYDTISIEVCHPDESGKFNDVTRDSLIHLTAWLCQQFHLNTDQIIRHYDVTGKLCPIYYVEHDDAWQALKQDIGVQIDDGA